MSDCFLSTTTSAIPITCVSQKTYPAWLETQQKTLTTWLNSLHFKAKPGAWALVPDAAGKLGQIIAIIGDRLEIAHLAGLPNQLPEGVYRFDDSLNAEQQTFAQFCWGLGAYRYTRFKAPATLPSKLAADVSEETLATLEAIYAIREWVTTPAEQMGPEDFAAIATVIAEQYQAKINVITDEKLLLKNFPALHIVGRASSCPPCLIEMTWGEEHHPHIALVGKGICFDTGGLDIKPASNMLTMKKDMAGAAHTLALARLIMRLKLPVRISVFLAMAENSISGNAFKPGDVITTRQGLTVEIINTDAEGRLALCDALTDAVGRKPRAIFDFATLTGAARVALGTDVAVYFCQDEFLATTLQRSSDSVQEPIWRLPLYTPYRSQLDSSIADIKNADLSGYGGAILAALFLKEFVPAEIPWAHFDIMAYNTKSTPGKPEGGEANVIRTMLAAIKTLSVEWQTP